METYFNVILIPAYNPGNELVDYVDKLIESGFHSLIIVNDGSSEQYSAVFSELIKHPEVTLLTHARNQGKGRALKTGFNHYLNIWGNDPFAVGIITVDSDGQHLLPDVIKISDLLIHEKDANVRSKEGANTLFLGSRKFDYEYVPFKSKFGNKLTSFIFALLYGKSIQDTQTGLRGIPKEFVPQYLLLPGERFEYEIHMLIYAVRYHQQIKEVPIQTVYINNNNETHFNPIKDSLKIYKVIFANFFRYLFSSLSSWIMDIGVFQIFLVLFSSMVSSTRILMSTVIARILSSVFNFCLNKKIVFRNKGNIISQMVKYYSLVIVQMLVSAGMVIFLHNIFRGNELVEKIIVDTVLFLISYQIQNIYIFRSDLGDS